MAEEKSGAALAVMLLLAVSLSGGDFSAGSDCSQSTTEVNARMSLVSAVVDTQRAEQSQRRHLEALFNRYGENGTISLDGLKRLLQSVGLNHVRAVMVQHHEQIGYRHHHHHHHHHHHDHHDHQEGHNHHHHPDDNHSHHQKHVHTEASRPGKFPKNVENPDGTLRKKMEITKSHHVPYDKKSTVAAQEVGTTAVYSAQLVLKQVSGLEQASPPTRGGAAAAARPGAGNHTQATAVSGVDDGDHDPEYDQDHVHINRSSESVECLNVSSILSSHGMSQEVGVTLGDFRYLCPALLNQIDYGACIVHGDDTKHGERDHKHKHAHGHHGDHNNSDHDHSERTGGESSKNITTAWVGGLVSISVISLLSLIGVVLIPLMNRVFFKFLLSFLVALAVGTLSGDAFLHLIPHSQGGHHHHHHEESGMNMEAPHLHDEHDENLDAVWKGLTALAGVYFMFLIEHFLTLGKMYKDKKKKVRASGCLDQ
nr:PREDICTED: zinc transporter ZIP6-like [Paralichthys olivaceus]